MRKLICAVLLCILMLSFSIRSASAYSMKEFYLLASKYKHINPFAATVQSSCETGNWTSYLWENGYNGAGLKVSSEWLSAGKPHISKESRESKNGLYVTETSQFRKYCNPQEFMNDYQNKIKNDYPRCTRNRDNVWGYFAGLYSGRLGKWATDHKYYEILTIKAVKLAPETYGPDWKAKLTKEFMIAINRRSLENWQRDIILSELNKAD